jgi:transposase
MPKLLRPNYAQRWLLPPSLEEWVPATHPVRFVRDFVELLDLSELGIEEPKAGDEGRPAYAPDLLLKVWLFGYMERIRSTRGLEKACLQVMPFLWLTGNLHPDHNTLWRFFNSNRKALHKLFEALVKAAAEAKLLGFVLHALDGTKLTAASSTDAALHRKRIDEMLKQLDTLIASYMQEVTEQAEADPGRDYAMPAGMADEGARRHKIGELLARRLEDGEDAKALGPKPMPAPKAAEPLPPAGGTEAQTDAKPQSARPEEEAKPVTTAKPAETEQTKADEPASHAETENAASAEPQGASQQRGDTTKDALLREAEALKKELTAQLAELDKAGVSHLHEGEPDARMMKGRGMHALGYNAQIVVDHESDLIVACNVVADQNDVYQLTPMLERVKTTLGRVADQTITDTGYDNSGQLKGAESQEMNVIVSLRDEPEIKGKYKKSLFRYDAQSNVYICPQDQQLVQIGTNKAHATQKHPDALYHCRKPDCPVRARCTDSPQGRQVRRPYGEDARERQATKQQDPRMRLLLGLRKEIVEHLFGIAKTIDGFRRFTVRGLEKVNAQWALVCTAINLRKLATMAIWKNGALVPRALAHAPAAATGATG